MKVNTALVNQCPSDFGDTEPHSEICTPQRGISAQLFSSQINHTINKFPSPTFTHISLQFMV